MWIPKYKTVDRRSLQWERGSRLGNKCIQLKNAFLWFDNNRLLDDDYGRVRG